ncbi:hypothetical protein HZ993_08165 [Rhodoferax sp. AJA081-3]|uniref:hypothetical protein n=1 Tax=Rhodoferax sp. AJA081-3 TaxID=2752316 RepID=UPI001AE03F1C|nr:hypothetical protein [Rhodoferax sp. AJA081-3]QTN29772.1 hypothetical protein HZ993_08165 [Rhodoferax sp. AJA081-3]
MKNVYTVPLGATVISLLLTACASSPENLPPFPADALPPPNLQVDAGKAGMATVRVVLQFKSGTQQAFDDENFVTGLQVQAQVPMHYITSVSADTHVYGLELPATAGAAPAVQRLQALTSVQRAELDTRATTK